MEPAMRRDDDSRDDIDDILREAAKDLRVVPPPPKSGAMPRKPVVDRAPPNLVVVPEPGLPAAEEVEEILNEIGPAPKPLTIAEWRRTLEMRPITIVVIALGLIDTLLWLGFFSGQMQPPDPVLDTRYAVASARWSVTLTRQRIDEFVLEHRRLPADLDELGYPGSDLVDYERISYVRYQLTAPSPDGPVTFDSIRPRDDANGRGGSGSQESGGGNP